MLLLVKVLLGLFLISLIIVSTIYFHIIGFLASVLVAFILNNGIERYERSKAKQTN